MSDGPPNFVGEGPTAPPTVPGALTLPVRPSSWPTVLGTIAIVFGAVAALGGCWGAMSPYFLGAISRRLPQAQVNVWGVVEEWKVWIITASLVTVALAAILLAGGVGLVRRRRWAMTVVLVWAVLKMLLIVASSVVSARIQQSQWQAMQQGGIAVPGIGSAAFSAIGAGSIVVGIAWGWALPVFLLIWFSRGRIRSETSGWT